MKMTKTAKRIYYGNSTTAQKEHIESRIRNELGSCQSMLVDMLLSKQVEGFDYENIQNFYWRYENAKEYGLIDEDVKEADYEPEPQEIFEWWPINSSFMVKDLVEQGEPVLSNDYGDWWGRTCTGQAISLDPTFWTIFQDSVKEVK